MLSAVAAVDLGATSGRVMLGHVDAGSVRLDQVARFANGPVRQDDGLHWDVSGLYGHALDGLAAAVRAEPGIRSIGVDSWAVDYAIIRGGGMLAEPFHYRDERNLAAADAVHELVSAPALYAANGLQFLPFNTLYQLTADRLAERLADGDQVLLVPDLLNFWMTGARFAEVTNASTTGLRSIHTGRWDLSLVERLQLPSDLLPPLIASGERIGTVAGDALATVGAPLEVVSVGSHDTASAVVAVPATGGDFAYISCGTWGLVGVELEHPVLTEASRLAGFTNEGGVDGRIRYLHNVMGLWLLSESVREWEAAGEAIDLPSLLDAAAAVTVSVPLFDANDQRFLAPGDMPAKIAAWLTERERAVPESQAEFVRSIIESLADAFVRAVRGASSLAGKPVSVIHIVGGGSQNGLLCQLVADRSGMPVLAGPVEATALGNVLVQARAQGIVTGDLESLRAIVAASQPPRRYSPASKR
jgi:rhamnulokinase